MAAGSNSELSGLHDLAPTGAFAWIVNGRGLLGSGIAQRIDSGSGPDRFECAADELERTFALHRHARAFASFTFDPDDGSSSVVIPEKLSISEPVTGLSRGPDKIRYAGSSIDEIRWMEAVADAVKRIEAGNLQKVVLARDVHVWAKVPFDTRVLAARLARRFPECYTFIHDDLIGATPELLVRRQSDRVESRVLAGTAPRGADPTEDAELGRELLGSAKNAGEHRFAVESVVETLGPICSKLTVESGPELLRLANVQHLATRVSGKLRTSHTALEIAGRLHPTAAVCGTPTPVAMDVIRELEAMDRSRYGGPVGWVDASGDGEFGIALRCAEVDGTRARLFAGNGIVAGSLPEDELEETRLKLRAMQSALEEI